MQECWKFGSQQPNGDGCGLWSLQACPESPSAQGFPPHYPPLIDGGVWRPQAAPEAFLLVKGVAKVSVKRVLEKNIANLLTHFVAFHGKSPTHSPLK